MLATAAPSQPTPAPVVSGALSADDDASPLFSLEKLKRQFERYLGDKAEEIEEARDARRVYHGVQWSAEELRILRDRGQPPSTYNKTARKVDGIVGIAEKQRQDPKAYPRNPRDDQGADVATVVVRYVCERNEWTSKKPQALRQALVDGIAGVEFRLVGGDHGDPDIEIHPVATEDFFYDPASIRPNFTDARFMGLSKWMDIEEAVELFPDHEEEIRSSLDNGGADSIPSDRDNRWFRRGEKRLRMVEHWYIAKGQWCWAFYVGGTLLEQGISPFFDDRGKTIARFEMFSAIIDQDGDRYGIVRNLKPIQKEINQRLSALLRLALSRRVQAEKGAVDNVETARREWARPDGWIEVNPNKQMKPDDTSQQVAEHTALLQLAMNEMEAFYNVNPASLSDGRGKNLSGRAVNLLQAPGLAELSMLLLNYRNWVIRCYRVSWTMAQRFWTAERWIRVTDDQKVAQFVQVNGLALDQYGQPAIVNEVGALDVDIVMDEGPDVQNMAQDAMDQIVQIAPLLQPGQLPLEVLVKLMQLPGNVKELWEQHLEQGQHPDPVKQQAQQLALHEKAADIDKTVAETARAKAMTLSALGSAAHKTQEAHIDGARVFAGGLQATGVAQPPENQAALPPQPQGPMQGDVAPGRNAPPTAVGAGLPMVPGASPGVNGILAGQPPAPPPVGQPVPGVTAVPGVVAPSLHIHKHDHHAPHPATGLLAGL